MEIFDWEHVLVTTQTPREAGKIWFQGAAGYNLRGYLRCVLSLESFTINLFLIFGT
ncbi:hypothetical protein RHMOL_Rhmol02G0160000 [Rhododendron molle]|uniref:Uncharacterized protein n=1 Tax=Rhododendron molle TaxID=49168 RepID=A0ACC0PSA4_RHOML|nr:hypothetical protein RHMOL_Rhmol02G0160000 [Rhododendron molle]